jgi:hypothetical protein
MHYSNVDKLTPLHLFMVWDLGAAKKWKENFITTPVKHSCGAHFIVVYIVLNHETGD